jgi:hypothetical protein
VSVSHIVHERPHIEDASPARFENVVGFQWIRKLTFVKAPSLVLNAYDQAIIRDLEPNSNPLSCILVIAMHDGIRHGLSDRQAHPITAILVEADQEADALRNVLNQLQEAKFTSKEQFYFS